MSLQYCIDMARSIPFIRDQKRLFAVVLDKKNRIVSEASNSYTLTHPKQFKAAKRVGLDDKIYCHAELLALIRDKSRRGVKLIVARVTADGKPANAKPCVICETLLKEFKNIQSVEYTI